MLRERKRIRVFVVDDEPLIASTLETVLNAHDFDALAFIDPSDALQTAITEAPPDVLVTDVMMPQMNGVELARRMKESFPKCQVLLFSGHASTETLVSNANFGGWDFQIVAKPFHPEQLIKEIKRLIHGKHHSD